MKYSTMIDQAKMLRKSSVYVYKPIGTCWVFIHRNELYRQKKIEMSFTNLNRKKWFNISIYIVHIYNYAEAYTNVGLSPESKNPQTICAEPPFLALTLMQLNWLIQYFIVPAFISSINLSSKLNRITFKGHGLPWEVIPFTP